MLSDLPWPKPNDGPTGFLAVADELMPLALSAIPASVHVVGSKNMSGAIWLLIQGPYIEEAVSYVLKVTEGPNSRTVSVEKVDG